MMKSRIIPIILGASALVIGLGYTNCGSKVSSSNADDVAFASMSRATLVPSLVSVTLGGALTFTVSGDDPALYTFAIESGSGSINPTTGVFTAPGAAGTTIINLLYHGEVISKSRVNIVTSRNTLPITPLAVNLAVGDSLPLKLNGAAPYTFTFSNPSLASVTAFGVITALTPGSGTLFVVDAIGQSATVPVGIFTHGTQSFAFTNGSQNFVVPANVTRVTVKAWGGGGGGGGHDIGTAGNGGGAGFARQVMNTSPNESLTVVVAGGGQPGVSQASLGPGGLGGFGGGARGGGSGQEGLSGSGGGGGGASGVGRGTTLLCVAGGGGGGGGGGFRGVGGHAGAAGFSGEDAPSGGIGGLVSATGTPFGSAGGDRGTGDGGGGGGGGAGAGQFFDQTTPGGGGGGSAGSGYDFGGGGGAGGLSTGSAINGSGMSAGNQFDADNNGAGAGGAGALGGANGRVVISW